MEGLSSSEAMSATSFAFGFLQLTLAVLLTRSRKFMGHRTQSEIMREGSRKNFRSPMGRKKTAQAAKPAAKAQVSQNLPSKHAGIFKQVVRSYESKQYRSGVKLADSILKKYPQHGETLTMKGLIYNCMGRRDEAEELIRLGLRMNIKSHICWHVFGLFHRSDGDYAEATKCYLNALRMDNNNPQIMKDLASLQIQMRDLEGFTETRRLLLHNSPSVRANWMAFAVGNNLVGNHDLAASILACYEETSEDSPDDKYERSELIMYRASILQQSGNRDSALAYLEKSDELVVDRIAFNETRAELMELDSRFSEARVIYMDLLTVNSESKQYFEGVVRCSKEEGTSDVNVMRELKEMYPKSDTAARMYLHTLQDDQDFAKEVTLYILPRLRKGIPSLFNAMKGFYNSPARCKLLQCAIAELLTELKKHGRCSPNDEEFCEAPSVYLWALLYSALESDFMGDYNVALHTINEAIDHTPTAIDLYLAKAKIYKHGGDALSAFNAANSAREMDLADRYLNTNAVRYAFAAGLIEDAISLAGLFLRDGDDIITMYEMQASWYEIAHGHSHWKAKEMGKALKQFTAVQNHFDDMENDQFDFHLYSLRKMTLRAYIDLLNWEDSIRQHRYYREATTSIVQIYLELHNNEDLAAQCIAQNKSKKSKKDASKKSNDPPSRAALFESVDPHGNALLKLNPLDEALKHVEVLEKYNSHSSTVLVLASQVYCLQKKWVLALRALKRADSILDLDATSKSNVLFAKVSFLHHIQTTELNDLADVLLQLITSEVNIMLDNNNDVTSMVSNFGAEIDNSHAMYTYFKMLLELVGSEDQSLLSMCAREYWDHSNLTLATSIQMYELIVKFSSMLGDEMASNFFTTSTKHFPLSTYFRV